jgi:glycosyltransferase involved in cell wall biosynthesis
MDKNRSKNSTTLCAIAKDERPYIVEWLAYHQVIGFDHFMIYSNDCSDGTDALLDRLAAAGIVEHTKWPSVARASPQRSAYNDAVRRCKSEWIAFLDLDEFLNLKSDDSLSGFLARFPEDVSAIALNWRVFGSGGEVSRREAPVLERFIHASLEGRGVNRHCKTIARVRDIEEMHIHSCDLKRGRYVDSTGAVIEIERQGFTPTINLQIAQVNHYVVKSLEEFEEKKRRGNANRAPGSVDKFTGREGEYFQKHDLNDEEESSILQFMAAVRERMAALTKLVTRSSDGEAPTPEVNGSEVGAT